MSPAVQLLLAYLFVSTVLPHAACSAEDDQPRLQSGDLVVLQLDDGRVARGSLVGAPDADPVVLRTAIDGIEIRSRFAAVHVVRIDPAEEFEAANGTIRIVDKPRDPNVPQLPPPRANDAPTADASRSRIRALSIDAAPGNWDGDPESDGLLVHVLPLDEYGEIVPTDGWLSFELTVEQFTTSRRLPWKRRGRPFVTAERWNVRLRRSDFGRYGAYVKFPYRQLHPQFDLDVAPEALLRGRLAVRGEGVFEAADANVRIRPLSRFRDDLEQLTSRRFLPSERTGRWPSSPSSRLRSYP